MNQLTLKNPKWKKLLTSCVKEYRSKGQLDEFIRANGFNKQVLDYIKTI